jgi:PIN domain nuclease of toxin-antitoxin system
MQFLLDTHTFLWFIQGSSELSSAARLLIDNPANQPLFSVASLWEIAIKISQGKFTLPQPFETFFAEQLEIAGVDLVHITIGDTALITSLPFHHRDPFDRILISQAITRKIAIVSRDSAFDAYAVKRLW